MPNLHLELKDKHDVERAMGYVSWLSRPVVKDVSLDVSILGEDKTQKLEKRLHRLFNDCGCVWGAPGFFLGFGTHLVTQLPRTGFSWTSLGVSALIGAGSAIGAKFLGLLWSCWQLHRTLTSLKTKLSQA